MFEYLKKLKPLHWIYNLAHYRELQHNRQAFKDAGIHRPLFASLSSKNFPDKISHAWPDTGDSALLAPGLDGFNDFTPLLQDKILSWSKNGFIILEKYFDEKTVDQINSEIAAMISSGRLRFENGNKLMFANNKSAYIKQITNDPEICSVLSFLLGKKIIPFQTINFITGSGQRAHSDSIHMTTYPLGYLIAVWIALEDTNESNGPLFYYPGSHKLPYVLNEDFNAGETALMTGKKLYRDYEDVIEQKLSEGNYQKQIFHAKKGDVFIWHGNLVHGGLPILNESLTRKSMVVHYFAEGVIKYHEISERPSLLKA